MIGKMIDLVSRTAPFVALGLLIATCPMQSAQAQQQPLIMEDKTTLFQRILTRPQAELTQEPGAGSPIETLPPFEMFYVYERREVDGVPHLQVGRTLSQGPEGWLPGERTIDWKQAIVLGFNNPANRERTLIFRSREALEESLTGEDVVAHLAQLRENAIAGRTDADGPIVSIEPEDHVDIESNFYILPILETASVRLPTRISARLLKIASLSQIEEAAKPEPQSRQDMLQNYKVGLVFVIDTTRSMRPYIDEVRNAVSELKSKLATHPEADRFRFGLVGFRDNMELVPALEYVSKTFLPLDDNATADRFLEAIDTMDVAEANSVGFSEDSVAGIMTALDDTDWEPFGGRFIVLITDAGPRPPGPEAKHGMLAAPELQRYAQNNKNAAIFAMHLKTPAGRFEHEEAAAAYQQLARFSGTELYYGIEEGDSTAFREQIDSIANALTQQISLSMDGFLADVESEETGTIERDAQAVGRAMQLAYLGREGEAGAPEIFEGWLTDRDPIDRTVFPVEPYVLMSRNELSTLRDVMMASIEIARNPDLADADSGSGDFFAQLREQAALVSRSPEFIRDAGTLGDILGEYLADLPYNSPVLSITPDDWNNMGAIGQSNLLDSLESRVAVLARIHDDAGRWFASAPDTPDGEYMTLVPLSLMP